MIQSSTAGFFQLSGGFLGWSYIGLILGRFLGLTAGFIQYAISFYKSSKWNKRDKLLEKSSSKNIKNSFGLPHLVFF